MSIVQLLFSFQGRVRRLHFWIVFLVLGAVYGGLFWQFGHMHVWHGHLPDKGLSMVIITHNPFLGLLGVVAIWVKLAVLVKRWHDRDKSGWWVLISLIPLIGWLWQLIECGFLEGTSGGNKYGPSPK